MATVSWWAALQEYVKSGEVSMGKMSLERAPFLAGMALEEKAT